MLRLSAGVLLLFMCVVFGLFTVFGFDGAYVFASPVKVGIGPKSIQPAKGVKASAAPPASMTVDRDSITVTPNFALLQLLYASPSGGRPVGRALVANAPCSTFVDQVTGRVVSKSDHGNAAEVLCKAVANLNAAADAFVKACAASGDCNY